MTADTRSASKPTVVPGSGEPRPESVTPWWQGAVIYQVYPRSFRDSNGDGIGDLRGCIEGLDHIASLGVDAIWLSPFFTSPMDDFGYDVSDYRDVDPMFGTLADLDELLEKAHARDLKIIIDQVYSHTSDQHPWFQESRQDRKNARADWYVWADPKPDGSPPNNWQSVFGGCAWAWDNRRRQYYLHNFLTSQPDLNLHNTEVQDAMLDVAKYWLDRGVDGFRLDAINFAMHDPKFRDNPPARVFSRPPTRPFDFQEHKYNQSHSGIPDFIERIRALTDSYDGVFTVAEVGGPNALGEMKAFTSDNRRLNSAYSFAYLYADNLKSELVKTTSLEWPGTEGEGWPSWAFSNHDAPRAVSRWSKGRDLQAVAKCVSLLLTSLRGNVFLYQGEELGLPQAHVPFEMLKDPEAIENWPETLGRDGARTPLPWNKNEQNAGFSTGNPWLPVDPNHFDLAIDAQEDDPDSVLNFTRELIGFRSSSEALKIGDIEFLDSPENVLAFRRKSPRQELLCVFNLTTDAVDWKPTELGEWQVCKDANVSSQGKLKNIPDSLPAIAGYIVERKN